MNAPLPLPRVAQTELSLPAVPVLLKWRRSVWAPHTNYPVESSSRVSYQQLVPNSFVDFVPSSEGYLWKGDSLSSLRGRAMVQIELFVRGRVLRERKNWQKHLSRVPVVCKWVRKSLHSLRPLVFLCMQCSDEDKSLSLWIKRNNISS